MRKYTIRFAVVILVAFFTAQSVSAATLLIPVGEVIGLQLKDDRSQLKASMQSWGRLPRPQAWRWVTKF